MLVYLYYQFIIVHVIDNYTSHYRRLFDISCSVRIQSMAIVLFSTVCKSTVFSKLRKKYFYVLSIFQASLFLLPLLSALQLQPFPASVTRHGSSYSPLERWFQLVLLLTALPTLR